MTIKKVAMEVSSALYSTGSNLRPSADMKDRLSAVVSSIDPEWIGKTDEWPGCVANNLMQIERGDMDILENVYVENGHQIKIISTSQLAGIHSGLKRLTNRVLSMEVGLRILDIYLLHLNLRVGASFGRNPEFGHAPDINQLARSAILCHGTITTSPQGGVLIKAVIPA